MMSRGKGAMDTHHRFDCVQSESDDTGLFWKSLYEWQNLKRQ